MEEVGGQLAQFSGEGFSPFDDAAGFFLARLLLRSSGGRSSSSIHADIDVDVDVCVDVGTALGSTHGPTKQRLPALAANVGPPSSVAVQA